MNYPLIPKSNKKLKVGDYWVMKLSNKSHAVGIVVDTPPPDLKLTREIIIGLLDWNDTRMPKTSDFTNSRILVQGHAHIKSIVFTGKEIIGNVNLKENNISSLIMIGSYGANGRGFHLMKGYQIVGKFENSDRQKYPTCGYWGYDYIKQLAESSFVKSV